MVSWRNVCKPKAFEGLGFKSLTMMNRALHMKLAWGIISSPNSLWVQVLTTKYRVDPHNLLQVLLPIMALICGSLLGMFGVRFLRVGAGVWVMENLLDFGGIFGLLIMLP